MTVQTYMTNILIHAVQMIMFMKILWKDTEETAVETILTGDLILMNKIAVRMDLLFMAKEMSYLKTIQTMTTTYAVEMNMFNLT